MTKAEYSAAYSAARNAANAASIRVQREILGAYANAAKRVGAALLSNPNRAALREVFNELSSAAADLSPELLRKVNALVAEQSAAITDVDLSYIKQAVIKIDSKKITMTGLAQMTTRINEELVRAHIMKFYADGYHLSDRVWKVGESFDQAVREIINAGIAAGRDPAKIAQDIAVYVRDGRLALANRWGALVRGTPEWAARLPARIDYRAIRLIRSELHSALQIAGIASGRNNPAVTGEYRWVLGPGLVHCSDCLENAGQLYTQETVPDYPHPNCGCQVVPVLRDQAEFISALREWDEGNVNDQTRFLEEWYLNSYLT